MDNALLADARARFMETWHRIDSLFTLYAKSQGLNFTTMLVLELLCDSDVIYTQKDICEKLEMPKQFINSIITSFWEQGLVELKEAKDRRNKNIFLTKKGKEYAGENLRSLRDAENRAWECFTNEEVIAFVNAMEKYEKSFGRILNELIN